MSEPPTHEDEPETNQQGVALTLSLAMRLADDLGDAASVEIDDVFPGVSVSITPTNPSARSFGWLDWPGEITLHVGDQGGRWELEAAPEDLDLLTDIARSVIAGRVREVFAPGRSVVWVTLADGSVVTETGNEPLVGCLPLPFWRYRSRSVQYAPYE